jgi:hypothetical protein
MSTPTDSLSNVSQVLESGIAKIVEAIKDQTKAIREVTKAIENLPKHPASKT